MAGNGLRGIRERLDAYGGRVDIVTGAGNGFAVDIRLPLEAGVALLAPVLPPAGAFAIGPAEAAASLK
jgi:signal transduction histidine kinase